ncbi:Hsp90 cochaperone [Coemansia brasiliensis]|uniref:Hsp90 cochaperone n=1 Tax=Coemansia brasiliensis TaxID=2650707 RepID=A0A9W8IAB4_9FUNG|nr:Hsp90 cochaperone [Coemansia brasiliensis]
MAKAYKELGRMDEAKSALMRRNVVEHKLGRAINDEDEDEEEKQKIAEEWKEKGNKEFKKENWTAALDCYRNGLSYDMYSVKLHSNACMALINLKRWAQALKHAEQCIALEPDWVKGYYMKGRILSNESKLEQAQEVLQKAAQMEPRNKQIKGLLEEVNSRVEYVESRLRRRKPKEQQQETKVAEDSGNEQAVEDVDSDEDYCQDGTCRSPKTVKLSVTRKDIVNIIVDLCAAMVGVAMVWWFVRQEA